MENRVNAGGQSPRVALVSVGLGRIQRGFERYFGDLFEAVRGDVDVTVFKGGGTSSDRQRVPTFLRPLNAVARRLPLGVVASGSEYKKYKHDCLALGLSIIPELLRQRFDVLHFIDPPMAKVLRHALKAVPRAPQLIFTNGCNLPPEYYPPGPHIHHVAEPLYREALSEGASASRMTLIPCGIFPERFATETSRRELREKYGIAESTFVILAITAIKRIHKRVDYIIDEVSRLDGDVLLWIDGNPEDAELVEEARRRLGSRCKITHVPSRDVRELYASADVFVHAALLESFGLSIVEALSTGMMVLTHDTAHFRWLAQDADCHVDMTAQGALSARLRQLMAGNRSRSEQRAATVRERFSWQALKGQYRDMYKKIADARRRVPSHDSPAAAAEAFPR